MSAGVKGCVVTVVLIATFFPFVKNGDKGHFPKHVEVQSISHGYCADDERWWPGVSVVWEKVEPASVASLPAESVTKRGTITFGRCVPTHSLAHDLRWRLWNPVLTPANAASAESIALDAADRG